MDLIRKILCLLVILLCKFINLLSLYLKYFSLNFENTYIRCIAYTKYFAASIKSLKTTVEKVYEHESTRNI